MKTIAKGAALAGLATTLAFGGTLATSSDAEAHGKHRHRHGMTIIIGNGHHHAHGCGWLWWKWQSTGKLKWYDRWHHCKYGW